MGDRRARLTILILENRQMTANILAELLANEGYATRQVLGMGEAQDLLSECQPAMLLVDMGLIRPDRQAQWQELQRAASAHNTPWIPFSCSTIPDAPPDMLVLRSPGDLAAVVATVSTAWRKVQPFLGTTLVEKGLLTAAELEAALRAQRDLQRVGRSYPLGDLLARLGIVDREEVEKAVREQEL